VRLWRHAGRGRGITVLNVVSFLLGWLTIVAALASPLDVLSARLFSAHMAQHELLMAVAAPLLVVSRPLRAWTWGLAPAWRRTAGGVVRSAWIRTPWSIITEPFPVWTLYAAAVWLWHAPSLFDSALESESVHVLQHVSFFGSALLFWWAVLAKNRRSRGASLLSLFTTMIHTGALGALFVFSATIWYPAYLETSAAVGLTPIEDQQLGGLLMWFPAGSVYLIAAAVLALRWLARNPTATSERLLR
jgi:putative membrane protein